MGDGAAHERSMLVAVALVVGVSVVSGVAVWRLYESYKPGIEGTRDGDAATEMAEMTRGGGGYAAIAVEVANPDGTVSIAAVDEDNATPPKRESE